MSNRLRMAARAAPWLWLSGTVALLGGLSWDVAVHRLDGSRAAREGVLTLTNPGHALLAVGLGLTVAGSVLFLLARTGMGDGRSASQRRVARLGLLGLVALAAVSGGVAAWSNSSVGGRHPHAAVAAGSHDHTVSVARPGTHGAGVAAHRHAAAPPSTETHHDRTCSPDLTGAGHSCTAAAPAD